MLPLATAAQMKELDRRAIEERGVSSLDLMENAAHAVTQAVWELLNPPEDEFGPIGHGQSVVIVTNKKGAPPPTSEEQAQMDELRAIVESKNDDPTPRIAVFCGPGNNGGDGVAAARLLMGMGNCQVRAFFVGDRAKMTPDEKAMEDKLIAAGGCLEDFSVDMTSRETLEATMTFEQQKLLMWISTCDAMVDALFGIGLTRPVEGVFRTAVLQMQSQLGCPVVSCDVPSGVNADTGEVLGEAVRAKVTVTFTRGKPGLYSGPGAERAGEVRIVYIGIPHDLEYQMFRELPRLEVMHQPDSQLPLRPRNAHKGDFGKLFILAGSEGYTGAPVLAARAALRTGAGLVYLGVPREIYPIMAVKCDEAMPFPLPEDYSAILEKARGCDAALIGPGLGRATETEQLVLRLLSDLDIPVVLDADGINALCGHIDVLDRRTTLTVLTPHEGEFARLTGCALPVRDRPTAARDFAREHGCVLVLKGRGTVTAALDGSACINATGNPGMAKGGSGDVLAGMIAALLGQKHLRRERREGDNTPELVTAAVCFHGLAGDLCARKLGEYAMLPSDLIEALPEVLRQWTEEL
ncbi:NAD(P)H-hydrate dehydratase [Colidextribacter sp. OB.20]|uniref:NAD(P)H-hydrate dehydratase n=1 Tax=Colidextribacter sp. OB.20 TaxID=2304568 RepID=UPI00136C8D80|nr:NAD(P)H-hydrate dehydratase [Colidextribacter sp. OB.20]NBI10072.1 NAD(P)H-hydrate dehydratase [Colidextribacter sp. OB.20]